ncbi:isocitrate lyase/PEP mutase family protein [Bradyrhizobium sp. Leo121]|uniref:isocitrate lyase/PEP mutase family protein n=1 Tax=Bradyrhizobium sp. Leo121 TaxID=1571195 RepID=UPI001029FE3C|nr:isocitrate lyase/PEP mutase family protein [Bradyrhizobium sp. Leo121]RZN32185.1 carboxyvinyl-carboxyphosphonate phosphorylmutase [Bradyrhizobium sp. Leo121]
MARLALELPAPARPKRQRERPAWEINTAKKTIREMLEAREFIAAPGVFDLVSAKIAAQTNAKALYMTGFGTVASYLGYPDAGLATYTDMLDRASAIAQAVDKPVIADGDTGYGGLLNVHHTVRGYEKAGVAMIQIEDQQIPKKCGHTPNRHIISTQEMVSKIKVACDARSSKEFLILARTDARTAVSLDEAISRAVAYSEAGADAIFIEAPESVDEMKTIGASVDAPLVSNQLHGGKTPILPQKKLEEIGFSAAIYPTAGLFAAAQALQSVYEAHADGRLVETPLFAFQDFVKMIGFQKIWDFENRYADLLAAENASAHG